MEILQDPQHLWKIVNIWFRSRISFQKNFKFQGKNE